MDELINSYEGEVPPMFVDGIYRASYSEFDSKRLELMRLFINAGFTYAAAVLSEDRQHIMLFLVEYPKVLEDSIDYDAVDDGIKKIMGHYMEWGSMDSRSVYSLFEYANRHEVILDAKL